MSYFCAMIRGRGAIQLLVYGIVLAVLVFFLQWLELRFIIFRHAFEIYAGIIAILFTALGIWLATKLLKPKVETVVIEKAVPPQPLTGEFTPDAVWLQKTGLSAREMEVLGLMAEGYSNQQIAEKLFLSQNTIKSHTARVFEKLEVNRRLQAVEKARRMGLVR